MKSNPGLKHSSLIYSVTHMAQINRKAKWQIYVVSGCHISQRYRDYIVNALAIIVPFTKCESFTRILKIILEEESSLSSQIPQNVVNTPGSAASSIPVCREEIFKLLLNCGSLTVMSVIMSYERLSRFLVLVFFSSPHPNTECLIFEQRSCYIKAIHYSLYQLKQVRSALSGAWVRQQPATQSRSVWDL